MTTVHADMASRAKGEQGIALITVLVLMVLMSGLTAALVVSGTTETVIARNHQLSSEARAAAEAGLMHAAQLTITRVQAWQTNGFASQSAAMTALLRGPDNATGSAAADADNGSLEALGIPRPPARLQLAGLPGVFYEARLYDEDDPARGLTLSLVDRTRISEDNQPYNDTNRRLVLQATGYSNGDVVSRLEAMIGAVTLPGIVSNGSLLISGNPTLTGTGGSVHANVDLNVTGSPTVSQDATASGTYTPTGNPTVAGVSGGGYPNQTVPNINAADHLALADFILTSTGRITLPNGTVVCDASGNQNACKAVYGWVFPNTGVWSMNGNNVLTGTYYAQTKVEISGSPGSNASPAQVSVIAEGSINVSGSPTLRPDAPELLFVTNGDLKIAGNLSAETMEGQILVREQLDIAGNPSVSGQIIIQDVPSVDPLVTTNRIHGNPTITYNGIAGTSGMTVTAWRWR